METRIYDLEYFIQLANVAKVSVRWPEIIAWARDRPTYLRAEKKAAESLKGTVAYVPGNAGATHDLYMAAESLRKTLEGLARAALSGEHEVDIEPPALPEDIAVIGLDGRVSVNASSDSRLYRPFIESLQGVDVTRIRLCPVCGAIHWAQRRTKKVCDSDCRVKKWIRRNPERWSEIQTLANIRRSERERQAPRKAG